ncbi:MAG TPA: SpoIIIAH-like family protein [Candidatus Gallacutalibacter stercoravium]|nr:SpoIIIAH-like family protein [Candidatus Gallacutalibacter stercoravium]
MAFGKRQLVLAALVVALGAAVYLNWQFSDQNDLLAANTTTSTKELGEAQYVNTNSVESGASSQLEGEENASGAESESSLSSNASDYFAQTRLSRQQTRDEALDILEETIDSAGDNEETKKDAVAQTVQITQAMEQETNIENLVKAKGFAECVAFLQNGECTVAVSSENLLDSEAITIKDIVAGQAGISYDKIKIVAVK